MKKLLLLLSCILSYMAAWSDNITFADANVKALCVANWDTDGDGELSYEEAAAVTTLNGVFYNNKVITTFDELQFFTGLNIIDSYSFEGCESLTSVSIPYSVTLIGNESFMGCIRLRELSIPSSVTKIYYYAFWDCPNLLSFYVEWKTPLNLTSRIIFGSIGDATLYVPAGCKAAYETADYWKEFKEIVEMGDDIKTADDISLSSDGIGTYCSTHDLDFSEVEGLKAYIVSGFDPENAKLVLTQVTDVPAGTGLLLKGDEGEYTVPRTTTGMVYSNLLKGLTRATTVSPTDGNYTNFILANGKHGINFYTLSAAGTMASGKAYLQLPTNRIKAALSRGFTLQFDDEQTGIEELTSTDAGILQGVFDLQGRRVDAQRSTPNAQLKKGLYIVDGKKVMMR